MTQTNEQQAQPAKKPMDVKKIAIIAGVTVLVILVAIFVDSTIRYPKCQDETSAINVVIQNVLPYLDELADDEGFGLDVQEIETIGTAQYYPVIMTRFPKCDDSVMARRIVEERVIPNMNNAAGAKMSYLRSESIDNYRYYVVEVYREVGDQRETLSVIYVCEQNSQPFVRDINDNFIPVAEEEEIPLGTSYVRIRDSQAFYKDDTTGQLIPYGG